MTRHPHRIADHVERALRASPRVHLDHPGRGTEDRRDAALDQLEQLRRGAIGERMVK